MKALNRAIARTVSQLGRYGREGCHPPMLFALEQHLDALLTMERKQLEVAGMKFATLTGDGMGEALPGLLQPHEHGMKGDNTSAPDDRVDADMHAAMVLASMRDSGEARKLGITPASIFAQMHPSKSGAMAALEHACDAASNYAREGARYLLALQAIANPHLLPSNGDPVVLREYARKAIDSVKGSAASEQPAPPAPDVIDMTDPRNWQVGDVLGCHNDFLVWKVGQEGIVTYNDSECLHIKGHIAGQYVVWIHYGPKPAQEYFTWLRHGEAQQ